MVSSNVTFVTGFVKVCQLVQKLKVAGVLMSLLSLHIKEESIKLNLNSSLLPWRWRRYVPPKRRLTPLLHGATSQMTAFFKWTVSLVTGSRQGLVAVFGENMNESSDALKWGYYLTDCSVTGKQNCSDKILCFAGNNRHWNQGSVLQASLHPALPWSLH
jgi:hypothetical protein